MGNPIGSLVCEIINITNKKFTYKDTRKLPEKVRSKDGEINLFGRGFPSLQESIC